MKVFNNNFASIESMHEQLMHQVPKKTGVSKEQKQEVSFDQILVGKQKQVSNQVDSELKFSKHANERLAKRNIDLSREQVARLENGTNKARQKGIKESLVMVDNLAFIVNVKNNTVITAVNDAEDTVFTNIDGAVIS